MNTLTIFKLSHKIIESVAQTLTDRDQAAREMSALCHEKGDLLTLAMAPFADSTSLALKLLACEMLFSLPCGTADL